MQTVSIFVAGYNSNVERKSSTRFTLESNPASILKPELKNNSSSKSAAPNRPNPTTQHFFNSFFFAGIK